MFDAVLLAVVGIVCVLMTLIMLTFMVVVAFWETHRLLVLALVTVAYAGAAAAAFITLRARLQRWRAFSATLEQIKKDRSCFEKPNWNASGRRRSYSCCKATPTGYCRPPTGSGCVRRKIG